MPGGSGASPQDPPAGAGHPNDPRNELWLSRISTWEILVLCQKGRLALNEDAECWMAKAMALARLHEAPLTHRFLAATAKVHGLTLVTADKNLAQSKDFALLVNL